MRTAAAAREALVAVATLMTVLVAVALKAVAVHLRLCTAGDEGRQAIDATMIGRLYIRLRLILRLTLLALVR